MNVYARAECWVFQSRRPRLDVLNPAVSNSLKLLCSWVYRVVALDSSQSLALSQLDFSFKEENNKILHPL